VTIFLAQ